MLQAKLTKLWLDKPKPVEDSGSSKPSDDAAQNWPTVDLTVDDFRVGERRWGKLEAQASPVIATRSWEILRFAMTNPDAELTGQGQWSMLAGGPRGRASSRTTLDVELALKNGGALLARSGYPGVVKDTQGKIALKKIETSKANNTVKDFHAKIKVAEQVILECNNSIKHMQELADKQVCLLYTSDAADE